MYRVKSDALSSAMDRIEQWFFEHVDPNYFADGRRDGIEPLAGLHARWDGQQSEVAFFDGFALLSVDEAAAERSRMDQVAIDEEWPASWWSTDWQPFGADGMGQLLVLDVTTGEVLEFLHDDDHRPVHAQSLEAFLATYATQLESGERVLKGHYIVDPVEEAASQATRDAAQQSRRDAQAELERKNRPLLFGIFAVIAIILLVALWLR